LLSNVRDLKSQGSSQGRVGSLDSSALGAEPSALAQV
jgi:hypothetical protein